MAYDEFIDELRDDYDLPPIGAVPDSVLEEQMKIVGDSFMKKVNR